ncbi:leucine-rich repeat domain-containing protein [Abyssalbus ytuae]|uniref:Leucine-rich repeat domain-containing protein n=1 Tax=Abyssalbus ytuae TaxID=2926907 RepID=A0A9E7A3E2_9FLAO|nr:leucine-rich repeat domain-containing protein [Abyssalbus ytuae]UOB19146.1 leucine-rich repeat domain-containing protein [Abyssalbus ytuae]
MGNITEARERINEVISEGCEELNLSGLDLTTEELKQLFPLINEKLPELQSLHLSGNHLTSLPGEIGNLTTLRWLHLSGNQFTLLPAELGNLTNLEWLNLSGNKLTVLPAEIGNLTTLQWLYLSRNQLSIVPETINKMSNLKKLNLGHNPLTEKTRRGLEAAFRNRPKVLNYKITVPQE